jgi:hypothetical protein
MPREVAEHLDEPSRLSAEHRPDVRPADHVERAWAAGDAMTRFTLREGVEAEANIPYAGLHQLLRPLAARVDALAEPQAAAVRAALGLSAARDADTFLVATGSSS